MKDVSNEQFLCAGHPDGPGRGLGPVRVLGTKRPRLVPAIVEREELGRPARVHDNSLTCPAHFPVAPDFKQPDSILWSKEHPASLFIQMIATNKFIFLDTEFHNSLSLRDACGPCFQHEPQASLGLNMLHTFLCGWLSTVKSHLDGHPFNRIYKFKKCSWAKNGLSKETQNCLFKEILFFL